MFGEISLWTWMWAIIMFAIGGAAGFFISRQLKDKRTQELEEKLAATRTELADYRGEVNQHFLKTSLLVSKLTNNYREVYEHLATGAQKLCKEKPGTPKLDLPDTKILPTAETDESERPAIGTSATTVEALSETGIEAEATGALTEKKPIEAPAEVIVGEKATAADTGEQVSSAETASLDERQPAPEDIPGRDDGDEEVPLGAESAPSVDTELHKTHPSLH